MTTHKSKILISGSPEVVLACQELLKKVPQWEGYYSDGIDQLLHEAIKFVPDVIFMDLLMTKIPADEMIKSFKRSIVLNRTVILTYYVPNPKATDHFNIRAQMIAVQYMNIAVEQAGTVEYVGPFNENLFLDLINTYRNDLAI